MATNVRTLLVPDPVPQIPQTHLLVEEEDDEISNEELAGSYIVKINENLQGQVLQLSQDNLALEKEVATLKGEILKNNVAQSELDHLRKIVRMMNSRTTSLNHILYMGTTSKARDRIGYPKGSSNSKSAVQKKNSHLESAKIEELVRMLIRTRTSCPNKRDKFLKKEGKEVRCYYFQKMGHIIRHYRHYKYEHKRKLRKNKSVGKPTWVNKGKTKSFIVLTYFKAEIEQSWYYESGSSRHTTGNKWLLSNIVTV